MKTRIKGVRELVIQYFFNAVLMIFFLLAFLSSFFMLFFRLYTKIALPSSEQLGWILSASILLGLTCYLLYFVGPSIMNKINTTLEYADPA